MKLITGLTILGGGLFAYEVYRWKQVSDGTMPPPDGGAGGGASPPPPPSDGGSPGAPGAPGAGPTPQTPPPKPTFFVNKAGVPSGYTTSEGGVVITAPPPRKLKGRGIPIRTVHHSIPKGVARPGTRGVRPGGRVAVQGAVEDASSGALPVPINPGDPSPGGKRMGDDS